MSAATSTQPTPVPGYQLIKRLGRGGFGEVWEVEAQGGIRKAMKFVYGDLGNLDDENIRAAEQELKALERVKNIRHPYILSLEQWMIVEGQLIIVMELATGNLWDRFKHYRSHSLAGIPREELLGYMSETAEALDLLNEKFRIQHLDVKPQNLFLMYNHVKVADFGLAKAFEGGRGTVTGGVTPVYAGPETFEGSVSRYTDQYSLAIVFQELLTGTRPFNGSNTKQLVMQHLNGTPDLEPLPAADRPIIARALSKKPEDRWPTCTDLVRSLRGSSSPSPTHTVVNEATTPQSAEVKSSPIRSVPPAQDKSPAEFDPKRNIKPTSGRVAAPEPRIPSGISIGKGATVNTPWPLTTPRLVTPTGNIAGRSGTNSISPVATLQRPVVVQTARMSTMGLAQPVRTGPGVLLPALIVGLGHSGYLVLRSLKRILQDHWGSNAISHIRFLVIDTDAETQNLACDPSGITDPFNPGEVCIAKLNRAAHYLQTDGLPPVDNWMPPGLLYKLPRNPSSAESVRAFGRIALIDHYRLIAQRIRQELESFVTEEPLNATLAKTNLGLRSTQGRIYVVSNTAGGTGSGMFLDIAYIAKSELRQIGYGSPETIGMLMVPPADRTVGKNVGLANTYAALSELGHFHGGKNIYKMRFSQSEPQIQDASGPFTRCGVFQLSKKVSPHELALTAGMVARTLYFELLTPLGREADSIREEAFTIDRDNRQVVQASSHYRLCWPRSELLNCATKKLAQRLLQRWTSKESDHLREPIASWLGEQWRLRNLELEVIVEGFNEEVSKTLREDPDRVFEAFVEPLRHRSQGASRIDTDAVYDVLEQLLGVVGPPEVDPEEPSNLGTVIAEHKRKIVSEAEGHLSAMAVAFVEQPQYRLSGTQEVIRQILERLRRTVSGLEGVRAEVSRDVQKLYAEIVHHFKDLETSSSRLMIGPRKQTTTNELLDVLVAYPKQRLKLHVLDNTLIIYRTLLSSAPEYEREIEFCRARLLEILNTIGAQKDKTPLATGPGRMILPHGVEGIDGAVDLIVGAMPPQDLIELDAGLQTEIVKQFRSVISVCIHPQNVSPFVSLLSLTCREFLQSRLEQGDPASMFFRYRSDTATGTPRMLINAFEESAPDITSTSGKSQLEATILGTPPGPDGEKFKQTVESVMPGIVFHTAGTNDELVFYREYPLLRLSELPQLSQYAREVYEQKIESDTTPHARNDIAWRKSNTMQ